MAIDYRTAIADSLEEASSDDELGNDICKAYSDDTGRHSMGPWSDYATYFNERLERGRSVQDRGKMLLNLMRKLINDGKPNRAITVCKAVTQVYRLRREPLSLSDTAKAGPIAKQKEVAEQKQQEMLAAKGTSKPTVTMNLRKVHELIADEYAKKGIANLTTTFVRTVCQLADRMLGCSRPQDPAGHLAGTEDFLGASGFADAQKVAVRFYDNLGYHERRRPRRKTDRYLNH
jgi:hypothetical protein